MEQLKKLSANINDYFKYALVLIAFVKALELFNKQLLEITSDKPKENDNI